MRRETQRRGVVIAWAGCLLLASLSMVGMAHVPLEEFDMALSAMPLASHGRILAAMEANLGTPGFPSEDVLQLIHRLASIPAAPEGKESILLLLTRALEQGLPIDGLLPILFDLANALEEGFPVEGVVLEALKGMTQGVPIEAIEGGLLQRLSLLREVRDLLFEREIFRASPGMPITSPTTLAAESFDQLLAEIADTISDHLSGGGSPFDSAGLDGLVTDRLTRLANAVVPMDDVQLVLERIEPADLTRLALSAID